MGRGQFTFYRSYYEALLSLPKKDREPVLMAIISYALDGEIPKLSGVGAAIFSLVKPTLDTGRKRAENGKQGGAKHGAQDKQTGSKPEANAKQTASEKEKEKEGEREKEKENDCYTPPVSPPQGTRTRFTPPTVGEVLAYCRERGNSVDPGAFVDFYASKGWKVGNQPMKDWKAAVRTWEREDRPKRATPKCHMPMPNYRPEPKQGDDLERLERMLDVKGAAP